MLDANIPTMTLEDLVELNKKGSTGEFTTVKRYITPEVASFIINHLNDNNRRISGSDVTRYRRAMIDGKWLDNCVPVIFAKDGFLMDGQHRLSAIATIGKGFEDFKVIMTFSFGADNESYHTIDSGKKRSNSDALSKYKPTYPWSGEKIPSQVHTFAATISLSLYKLLDCNITSLARESNRPNTKDELYKYADEYLFKDQKTFERIYEVHKLIRKQNYKKVDKSLVVALYVIFMGIDRDLADSYYKQLSGIEVKQNSVAASVINRFRSDYCNVDTPMKNAATVIKGWNALREGKACQRIKFSTNETMPQISGLTL